MRKRLSSGCHLSQAESSDSGWNLSSLCEEMPAPFVVGAARLPILWLVV